MVKNRYRFCDILTISSFKPVTIATLCLPPSITYREHLYKYFSTLRTELVLEATLFFYSWSIWDVADFEVILRR